jgi:hypothetical protein
LAAADFGDDSGGFGDDLLVGEPYRTVDGVLGAGRAVLYYVQAHNVRYQVVRPGLNGATGAPHAGAHFGWAVTTGNFDGNAWADVAVGAPGTPVGSQGGAGAVSILLGSSAGITTTGSQLWDQDSPGIVGTAEKRDHFGWSVSGRTE